MSTPENREFVLHLHNHAGWRMRIISAISLEKAISEGLKETALFLSEKYANKHRIECDDPNDNYPRYRVIWDCDEPKIFPLHWMTLRKGDVWWSDRFQVGEKDDCSKCGGTGINHYYSWKQCWECGDSSLTGKGSGKARTSEKEDV